MRPLIAVSQLTGQRKSIQCAFLLVSSLAFCSFPCPGAIIHLSKIVLLQPGFLPNNHPASDIQGCQPEFLSLNFPVLFCLTLKLGIYQLTLIIAVSPSLVSSPLNLSSPLKDYFSFHNHSISLSVLF